METKGFELRRFLTTAIKSELIPRPQDLKGRKKPACFLTVLEGEGTCADGRRHILPIHKKGTDRAYESFGGSEKKGWASCFY